MHGVLRHHVHDRRHRTTTAPDNPCQSSFTDRIGWLQAGDFGAGAAGNLHAPPFTPCLTRARSEKVLRHQHTSALQALQPAPDPSASTTGSIETSTALCGAPTACGDLWKGHLCWTQTHHHSLDRQCRETCVREKEGAVDDLEVPTYPMQPSRCPRNFQTNQQCGC